jgi:hypothetical protein
LELEVLVPPYYSENSEELPLLCRASGKRDLTVQLTRSLLSCLVTCTNQQNLNPCKLNERHNGTTQVMNAETPGWRSEEFTEENYLQAQRSEKHSRRRRSLNAPGRSPSEPKKPPDEP